MIVGDEVCDTRGLRTPVMGGWSGEVFLWVGPKCCTSVSVGFQRSTSRWRSWRWGPPSDMGWYGITHYVLVVLRYPRSTPLQVVWYEMVSHH